MTSTAAPQPSTGVPSPATGPRGWDNHQPSTSLTPEQVRLFRHNGFLKLPILLEEATVAALKDAVWRHIREEIQPVVKDRQGRVVRISSLWQRGAPFQEVLSSPAVLDALESLLGPNIELVLNRHNHATLRMTDDAGEYFHRDVLQWTRTIFTIIFYLQETNLANGCTRVVPGTHMLPGFETNSVEEQESVLRGGILDQAVPVPMPAGGMLVIDSLLIHAPGRNTTAGTRMSMTAGYHSVDELLPPDPERRVLVRGQHVYLGNDR